MPVIFTQEWMGLSPDLLNIIAFILGAIVLVVVLWLIISAIRRPRFASSRRSRQARLAITDAALIDERRKLVLVRRDNVEHLVLIGGANDLVIEADIRAQPPAHDSAAVPARETAPPAQTVAPPAQASTLTAQTAVPPVEAAASQAQTAQKPSSLTPEPAREAPPKPAPVPAASDGPRVAAAPVVKPTVQSVEPVVRATPASTTAPPVSATADAPKESAPVVTSAGPKVAISQPQVTRRTDGQKPTMGDNMDALLNRISDDKKTD